MIYAGTALAAIGNISFSYMIMTYMGDVIDQVEWKTGVRADGFTGGLVSAMMMFAVGIAQGLFNLVVHIVLVRPNFFVNGSISKMPGPIGDSAILLLSSIFIRGSALRKSVGTKEGLWRRMRPKYRFIMFHIVYATL